MFQFQTCPQFFRSDTECDHVIWLRSAQVTIIPAQSRLSGDYNINTRVSIIISNNIVISGFV